MVSQSYLDRGVPFRKIVDSTLNRVRIAVHPLMVLVAVYVYEVVQRLRLAYHLAPNVVRNVDGKIRLGAIGRCVKLKCFHYSLPLRTKRIE